MLLKPWASEESPLRTKTDLCLGFRVLGRLNLIWVHKAVTRSHAVLEILCPGIWRVPFLYNCKFVCRFWGNRDACTAIWGECACPQINTDLTISYDYLFIYFYFETGGQKAKADQIKTETTRPLGGEVGPLKPVTLPRNISYDSCLLYVGFRAWSGTQFQLVPPPQFTPQQLQPV